MIIGATTDLIRMVSSWVLRADSGLAATAAANAARSMHAQQHLRHLDDARTLRDLESIPAVPPPAVQPVAVSR